ncbi:MAG: hypothetical protein R3246_13460 [Acidimicrobiia bacterium]|nr:hypothetical protein [Acidimicrobiia bacterium]
MQPTIARLGPRTPASRRLMVAAAGWGVSAVVHLGVLVATSGSWSGAVSFRKPIVFSASMGALMWAAGWVMDRLPHRPRLAGTLSWTIVVSGTIEVALIAFQAWRGRASHFNVAQPGDAAIFGAMGAMVGVLSVALLILAIWSVVDRPDDRAERWALLGGQAMVLTGLGIGQWIVDLGVRYFEQFGAVPDTVVAGAAGVAKFPHAVAFHGIHVFAVLWTLLLTANWSDRRRLAAMRRVVLAYGALLVVACARTIAGHAPSDVGAVGGAIAVLAGAVILGQVTAAGVAAFRPEARNEVAPVPIGVR